MTTQEWMDRKERLRAYLVEYGYSADPELVRAERDALAAGPDAAPAPNSLAMLKALYPQQSWPDDTPESVKARNAQTQS